MRFDTRIGYLPYSLGLLAIALALAITTLLAYWRSLQTLETQTQQLAGELIARSHAVSEQFDNGALKALLAYAPADPCSADSIEKMRALAINSRALRLIGYVRNDRLLCSSYGNHGQGIAVGPPTYVSRFGFEIRTSVPLAFAGPTQFLLTTHQQSGFAALVAPGLIGDIMPNASAASFGLFGSSSKKLMVSRGDLQPPESWLAQAIAPGATEVLRGEGHLVALKRSPTFDYVAYAAIPLAGMREEFGINLLVLTPLGLVSGLALAALVVLQARRRRSLPNLLRTALRRDELFLMYQPIVDLQTGQWVGAEALARWRMPNGAMVPPDVFIPVAESDGLIREVTGKVIELLAKDCAQLLRKHTGFSVSINFFPQDFADTGSVAKLQSALAASHIDPASVSVEITERALIKADEVRDNIRHLRATGIKIAIDDFGTGYAGLAYLATLDLDSLKIDKIFVDTIGTDAATSHVVAHIVEIAKSMGLKMVAEGVETEAQAQYLRARGVEYAQGWFYSKALAIDDLLRHIDGAAQPALKTGGETQGKLVLQPR
jgi:sensor c-di-GMP phosphodiesterase-like protein